MEATKIVRISRRKAVKWHAFGGWLSTLVTIVQGLVFVPLYIHYFGDRLYGFWLATGGILHWIAMVDIGSSAVTKIRCASAYAQEDLQRVINYFWHGLLVSGFVVCAFLSTSALIVPNLPNWLDIDLKYHSVITVCTWLLVISSALGIKTIFLKDFLTALQRNKIPVLGQTVADLIGLVFLYLGLVHFQWGLYSLAIAALVKSTLGLVIAIGYTATLLIKLRISNVWSRDIFSDYWKTTPAIFAAKATGTFTEYLPLVLITRFLGPEMTVAYNVTTRVLFIVRGLLSQGLGAMYGATAHFFSDLSVDNINKYNVIRQMGQLYTYSATAMIGACALLAEGFISVWTTEEHFVGKEFIFLFSVATFLQLRNGLQNSILGSLGALKLSGVNATIERLVAAALLSFFLFEFNLNGIPIALSLVFIVMGFVHCKYLAGSDIIVRKALVSLEYSWLPVSAIFFIAVSVSGYFVYQSWICYIYSIFYLFAFFALLVIAVFAFRRYKNKTLIPRWLYTA